MQRDLRTKQIDWVFCWRTSTGEVRPGARDTHFNGHIVRYQPGTTKAGSGLRTIVRGHRHTVPQTPTGPRLDEQGGISRMGCFVLGDVTAASLVPARDESELEADTVFDDAELPGFASRWREISAGREAALLATAVELGVEAAPPVTGGFLLRPEKIPEDGPEYEALIDAMTEALGDWLDGGK